MTGSRDSFFLCNFLISDCSLDFSAFFALLLLAVFLEPFPLTLDDQLLFKNCFGFQFFFCFQSLFFSLQILLNCAQRFDFAF
mmetsp:Transcript_10871/g.30472  ORF Transcript_10871/g.30472 Transcript_10871/m.30472 type:complete len:82 (-) Transcript_10871:338-583(-)